MSHFITHRWFPRLMELRDDKGEAAHVKAQAYLIKPFDPGELIGALKPLVS